MQESLENLNSQFAIPGHVSFIDGPGGLITALVENEHASATLTQAGAHVMTYRPRTPLAAPLLWTSPSAANMIGGEMRGGAPVCWPWFARHPEAPERLPMHGFVRTMLWDVTGTRALEDGSTEVRMRVTSTPQTMEMWPHAFELDFRAVFGPRLKLEWTARNPGDAPYRYTGAIHPYYVVSDIRHVVVHGLEDTAYLDKNEDFQRKVQHGPLRFDGPVDYVFLDTTREVMIEDPGLRRRLHIAKTGSHTTVVWNPHEADAQQPDVGAGEHLRFVCAEAANAFEDVITVDPGGEASLGMEIWAEETKSGGLLS